MSFMFSECSGLNELNIKHFKANKNINILNMFSGANKSCKIICSNRKLLDYLKNDKDNCIIF